MVRRKRRTWRKQRLLLWLFRLVPLPILALGLWLGLAPPDLLRVGSGYAAKIICSNVFLAGRDAQEVLRVDVQSPGHPLLRLMTADVDEETQTVRASLLGLFAGSTAAFRPGYGCAALPDGSTLATLPSGPVPLPAVIPDAAWPQGNQVEAPDPALSAILQDEALVGTGMRAVVVVRDGRIVAERYGPGFSPETRLLGWSMTKTVNAAIIGTLVGQGRLAVDRQGLFDIWADDERSKIAVADLMAMSSGLAFNEDYGDVTDVTRMLYLEPDMAGFAADKPLAAPIGSTFSYSSGTSVLLSRIWQNTFETPEEALTWPRQALFAPLGMTSAVLETDASGTFVGSSYLYATARDWARFGQLLLQDGKWQGADLLPPGYVGWMRSPAPASRNYGRGQLWLQGPGGGANPDAGYELPDDVFWVLGHDGQAMAIIPSRGLVILRMGLTPSRLGYKAQGLVQAVVHASEQPQ